MVKMSEREVIIKTALKSRLLLIVLQYISNVVISDHEADAFSYPKSQENGFGDKLVAHLFGGFVRWDAQHFMHISQNGYTYEHNLAFFPFCPVLVRLMVFILSNIAPFLSIDSLTLLVYIATNVVVFILSAVCLYELSLFIVSKDAAYKATMLFCYNPASVFFTTPYTESVYCYLTFKSMLNCILLYKKYCDIQSYLQVKDILYIIPICLSTLTRSNGVLNIGFLVYTIMCLYFKKIQLKEHILLYSIKFIIVTILVVSVCMAPFALFQLYSFQRFCTDFITDLPEMVLKQAESQNFVLPGTFSQHNQSWCNQQIPLAYSYIQSHYWKVGFFRYYEFKQIPNFMLASPLVLIIFLGSFDFYKHFPERWEELFNLDRILQKRVYYGSSNPVMVVFVIHAAALTVFCVLNIHVQVTTRMLCSASPVLYWFSATYINGVSRDVSFKKLLKMDCSVREYFILCYYLSYFVIGTVMFCNFLPWT